MSSPFFLGSDPINQATVESWRHEAMEYLAAQLGSYAPKQLGTGVPFESSPLEGDGAVVIFSFVATPGGAEPQSFYVVVGQTEPNYYPAATLTPREAFRVHLGTRFMLAVGVSAATEANAGEYDGQQDVRELAAHVAPGRAVEDVSVAAMFAVGTHRHAVCRCRLGGEEIYVMTRDCPPGFYRRAELAPHVVYRMHLGNLLLEERDEAAS